MKQGRRRAWTDFLAVAAAALLVGAAVGWAGATVLAPPQDVLAADRFTTVEIRSGEVGSSISLNAAATWKTAPVALNRATGTVTSVDIEQGAEVGPGSRLYTANLRPVVVGQGTVPAYAPLQRGDAGPQVQQLQQFLNQQGVYSGAVDGRFSESTERAVRAWQKVAGFPIDGVVQQSDIIWVPTLPARITLDSDVIATGRDIAAGAGDIFALSASPAFVIPMTAAQAGLAPQGTVVKVQAPDGSVWEAVVQAQEANSESEETVVVHLTAPDGGAVCLDTCSLVPATGQTLFSSEIVTVPLLPGLVVPTAAIRTDANGSTRLLDESGQELQVVVVQTARGLSLIEGVSEGTVVRIPAGDR